MAFDISTARPVQSGGFDISTAKPIPQSAPAQAPLTDQEKSLLSPNDLKLPIEEQRLIIEGLKDQFAAYQDPSMDQIPTSSTRRAQNLERIRKNNPYLAQIIEEMSPAESAAVGFQQGLRQVGRGAGKLFGQDIFPEVNDPVMQALQDVRMSASVGNIAGQAAPFLAAAPLTGTVGTGLQLTRGGAQIVPKIASTAGRAAATSALGAVEGGTIAAGQDRSAGEVIGSALLGGTIGLVAEGAPSLIGGASKQLPKQLIDEGEELLRRTASKRDVSKAIAEAAPSIETLRETSKKIYSQVKEQGINIEPTRYNRFVLGTVKEAQDQGYTLKKSGKTLTPQSRAIFELLDDLKGADIGVQDLENVRRAAQNAASVSARAGNNTDAAISNLVVDRIDELMTNTGSTGLFDNVGKELSVARNLWGRARKAELLDEALNTADLQASGIENGIRIKFRQIINNKRQSRFFNENELAAMRDVVEGKAGSNFFKRLGKLGFGSGQQTSVLSGVASSGVGAGILASMFGSTGAAIGAVLLPTVGKISQGFAEKITRNNAALANRVVRAGSDAEGIAKAYLSSVPKEQRNVEELAQLFMRPDVNLNKASTDIAIEAAKIARKERQKQLAGTAAGLTSVAAAAEEE